jgi:hypothetical protein
MEKGQYLVLGTAHIRCATGQLLNDWADLPPARQPLSVAPTQYGWFIPTRVETSGSAARHLPKEIPAILELGRAQGCDYVLLDCDGPNEDALPTFPW